jgi:hypothetical protein
VKGGLLLNVVIGKSPAVLQLLSSENEALLIGRDSLLVLNLGLHIIDGIRRLNLESDGLARQGLNKDLHTTTETKHYEEQRENEFESQYIR